MQLKNTKKKFKRIYRYFRFLNKKPKYYSPALFDKRLGKSEIDIASIIFRDPSMIEYQVHLIHKFLTDNFTIIVADNSSDVKIRDIVIKKCQKLKVHYVFIPDNPYTRNQSHGTAMHWVYKNVLKKRKSKYFGFIDHDIFPITYNSIVKKLEKKIYGRMLAPDYRPIEYLLTNCKYWSIWAGFSFYDSALFNHLNVYSFHFFPIMTENGVLDTSGGLWKYVYSKLSFPGELANYKYIRFSQSG